MRSARPDVPEEDGVSCPLNNKSCETWREWVTTSLEEGDARFEAHQTALAENTALTRQVEASTREIVEMLATIKSGAAVLFKIGRWAHRAAKWAIPLVSLGGILYAIAHGQWPKWGE